MNANDSCIIFASMKNEKGVIISKVSNNFEDFLGFKPDDVINQPVEKIMPDIYAKDHKKYISNFFERGDKSSLLKNGSLFSLTSSGHIIPVSIDVKVNFLLSQRDFGITAYV